MRKESVLSAALLLAIFDDACSLEDLHRRNPKIGEEDLDWLVREGWVTVSEWRGVAKYALSDGRSFVQLWGCLVHDRPLPERFEDPD